MATITVPKTRLATPLVGGEIDIEQVFNLFQTGMIKKPVSGKTFTVLPTQTKTVTLGPLRVNFDIEVLGSAGILGPGVGVCVDLEGTADGATASFTATNGKIGAGLEVGFDLRLVMGLSLQRWTVDVSWTGRHWHKHLKVTAKWVDVAGGLTLDHTFDLGAILINYVLKKAENGDSKNSSGEMKKLPAGDIRSGSGFSAVDYNHGDLSRTGTAHVEPTLWVMVNFADLADPPGAMKKLHDWMVDAGGDFYFGPSVNLSVPTTVKLTAVQTDGVAYNVTSVSGGTVACQRSGTSSVASSDLSATFNHRSGLSFGLGIGVGLHVFKIFGFYKTTGPVVDFVSLLGYHPAYGGDDSRTATIGATAAAAPLREAIGARYQVILEEPVTVA